MMNKYNNSCKKNLKILKIIIIYNRLKQKMLKNNKIMEKLKLIHRKLLKFKLNKKFRKKKKNKQKNKLLKTMKNNK